MTTRRSSPSRLRSIRTPRPCTPDAAIPSTPRALANEVDFASKMPVAPASAGSVGTDNVLAGAKAVVVARLRHAVAVCVEHEADMRERVPVGGILGVQHRRVVADEIGRIRIVVRDAIVHPRPAVAQRRAQHGRVAAGAKHAAARPIERQAQTKRDPFTNLARAGAHSLGRQKIEPAQLVVGTEVAPVRPFGSHAPSLRHG